MTERNSPTSLSAQTSLNLYLGLAGVLSLFIASGGVSYLNTDTLNRNAKSVTKTHEVLSALADVLSLVKDTETGQRGFLITGDERYLEPYSAALIRIDSRISDIERLTQDNLVQQSRISILKAGLDVKLAELRETIATRREKGFEAAREIVISDRGKAAMDAIRAEIAEMQEAERAIRTGRLAEMESAYRVAIASGIVTGLIGILLSVAVAYLVRRAALTRQWEDWMRMGQIQLTDATAGDPRLEQLGDQLLRFFAEYLDAQAGAFYAQVGGHFQRVSTYGVPSKDSVPAGIEPGQGLLGQAILDQKTFILNEVPEGYLKLGSALGQSSPRHLLIAPLITNDAVNSVLELGFIHPIEGGITKFFDRVSESIAVAVQSSNYRSHLQKLLDETQQQAEELQAQSEELRVSNEELEEQSRALKESQSRLEQQQAELEQTNVQLEEQTTLLEAQRDDASRARAILQVQTRELEQASQYKSDFLANMSHELRTPLNSSLILAKLLADNRQGNLSDEQIQYAKTIESAGNDLLALINDILDLSKIEAGHMEVHPEPVRIKQLTETLTRTFKPVAEQKGLRLVTSIQANGPESLVTDLQRLEQILKNILSNALKFTERGEVSLHVSVTSGDQIAFAITDTGIGIAEQQQQVIFEAFRQADGTTNRKYGGTGLGLSISRELTRLLGGEIHLKSEPGQGSTFTVTIPQTYDPKLVRTRSVASHHSTNTSSPSPAATSVAVTRPATTKPPSRPEPQTANPSATYSWKRIEDDRQRLTGDSRTILVVEDDESFARVMFDLAHELDFQCLIANSAEEGLAIAIQYLPSAVVLDVGLPDHSGLSVLDRLKHDSRTRHIPVHVVSAGDYAQTALQLGAVGYMLKPVKREELVDALTQLETRLAKRMRRVLVVEDDLVQLDSMRKLLGSREVEAVGARSAAECLEQLKETTFDCMVLDLSLPDASGYSLLETLSREDAYSFPPVIVYTGRALSSDEEQQLRRYSKSIIIKGVKSPERLLDEVTLFLHQVVSELPPEQQKMLEQARSRDAAIEGRRILIVEDDVRNVFALTSILEPRGAILQIARNGREALTALEQSTQSSGRGIDLVLMDVMMPEMDGITATREIRKLPEWRKLPIIMLTAKAMKNDQEQCLSAGANDYMAKPLDVEKLLSLVRVWMPR